VSGLQGNKVFFTLAPAAGIAITYFSMPFLATLDPDILEKLPYIPYLLILAVITMGGLFGRHRITYLAAILGTAYIAIHSTITSTELFPSDNLVIALVSVLLPLNIAFISSLKEQSLLSIQSFVTVSIILVQLLFSYWALHNYPQTVAMIVLYKPEALAYLSPSSISLTTATAYMLSFLVLLAVTIKNATVFEYAFTGALVSTLFFFLSGMQHQADTLYFVTANLIIAWALIHNSYLIAYIDELTELPGRRAMNEELARLRGLYTIAMLDIDHFKKFNDTYGHEVGDQVLRMVAAKISAIGGGGKPFRYGGEEFAILFPGKNSKTAFPYLSNLRETIDHSSLVLRNQNRPASKPENIPPRKIPWQEVHVTISIGVADSSEDLKNIDEILKAADDALYRAKEKGRNRISQYSIKNYSPEPVAGETEE